MLKILFVNNMFKSIFCLLFSVINTGGVPAHKTKTMPNGLIDVTMDLMGQTVYIESLYYPGWWVGSTDYHDGALFQLSESSVFDPREPCRLEIVDCWMGWACFRSRYREYGFLDKQDDTIVNATASDDPSSYFLEANYFDVDFFLDTASAQYKPTKLKWKILCSSEDLDVCYIQSREYADAQLYPTHDGLNTKYREDGDDDTWFRFRIMNPKFREISEEGEIVSETCNHSDETDLEVEFSYSQGISVTNSVGTTFSSSISSEVKSGCIFASGSGTISAGWQTEISTSSTWQESKQVTMRMTVKPGKKMSIRRLTGKYGTEALTPYEIGASNYNVYETNC